MRFNGKRHRVHVHVKAPGDGDNNAQRSAIVMFIEGETVEDDFAVSAQEASNESVRRLTQELELTHTRLRTVREESDAANEELRAANEELQSINEEYRSTSEELETSKEELQSINEELQTVNTELKLKLETISRAHSDLQNLMAATDFGTLFLDSSLRIKRFTDRVTEVFSVTPADEGRPITDFAHRLDYADLTKDARAVLSDLAPVRREVGSRTLAGTTCACAPTAPSTTGSTAWSSRSSTSRSGALSKKRCAAASTSCGSKSGWSSCRASRFSSGTSTRASSTGTAAAKSCTAIRARKRWASARGSCCARWCRTHRSRR